MVELLVAMTFDQLSKASMRVPSSIMEPTQESMTKSEFSVRSSLKYDSLIATALQTQACVDLTAEKAASKAQVHESKLTERNTHVTQQQQTATSPSTSSDAWKSILARHSTKDSLPSKPFTSESEHIVVQSSYANALPALARQHAAKLAVTPLMAATSTSPYSSVSFMPGTTSSSGMMTSAPISMTAPPAQVSQPSPHIITSSPSTTLATAAHLATMGVGVGPGINPNITSGTSGVGLNGNSSNPPIVNTGNNGPMYVQPGDWVCSACGFVNWRRRRVCMRCYPFADQTEVSKQIAQGAALAAQLAAGVNLSPDTITSLTLSRKSTATQPVPLAATSLACPPDASLRTSTPFQMSSSSAFDGLTAKSQPRALDYTIAQSSSASARQWQRKSPKNATFAQSDVHAKLFVGISRAPSTVGHADDFNGPQCTLASQSPFGVPRNGESSMFASAHPSPTYTPRKTCSNLAIGNGKEFPWSSGNIWSTPGTPNHFSGKMLNSPLFSPSAARATAAVGQDTTSTMDNVKSKARSVSPNTSLTSSPSLLEAQIGERLDVTDDASIKSALTSFIDENDEIVKPTPRSARRGFALPNSTSPPREYSGAFDSSSSVEGQYQHAAIEPPCRSLVKGSSDSAK